VKIKYNSSIQFILPGYPEPHALAAPVLPAHRGCYIVRINGITGICGVTELVGTTCEDILSIRMGAELDGVCRKSRIEDHGAPYVMSNFFNPFSSIVLNSNKYQHWRDSEG
jgi:hypothetical protein